MIKYDNIIIVMIYIYILDLHSSTLNGYWMSFKGPAQSDGCLGRMVRES